MSIAPLTNTEREKRARAVSEAEHSGAMEGLEVSPGSRADAAEYVEGAIDIDELRRRTKRLHGLPVDEPQVRP